VSQIDFKWPRAPHHDSSHKRLIAIDRYSPTMFGAVHRHHHGWGIVPKGQATWYRPLEAYPALYRELLNLDGTERSCLAFAKKYGLLMGNYWRRVTRTALQSLGPAAAPLEQDRSVPFEDMFIWQDAIEEIKDLYAKLSRGEDANLPLTFSLTRVKSDFPVGNYRCHTLLDAIKFQCVESFLKGRPSRRCVKCSDWFGDRRSHAKFCSEECKDDFHNDLKAAKAAAKKGIAQEGGAN
jgi:hypothetical protein